MASLKLNILSWDLDVDSSGNLALSNEGDETIAQDVAVAVRVWLGESYFDTTFGVPYREILAQRPAQELVMSLIADTAKTAAGVESIDVELDSYDKSRILTGKININGDINVRI
jgi:hypothetical protein